MKRFKPLHIVWYAFADVLASAVTWTIVALQRKILLQQEPTTVSGLFTRDDFFKQSLLLNIIFWITLYAISGSYNTSLYKKSRLNELTATCLTTLIGSIILLFILFLNDSEEHYTYFYYVFFTLFFLQSFFISAARLILLSIARKHIVDEKIFFNSLIVGNNKKSQAAFNEIGKSYKEAGHRIVGFLTADKFSKNGLAKSLPCLGMIDEVETIIRKKNIHEVIVALETKDAALMNELIGTLSEHDVEVKIVPEILEILSGSVKVKNVPGAVLIDLDTGLMPAWQSNMKRLIDVLFSFTGLVILSPVILFLALRTKMSSPGEVFFNQERIGYKGKAFMIHKFRSMYQDAEKEGPALSSDNDIRITPWGKVMRKWRLDEVPQLWNIIKGEMSFVGPRPERKFYIDQINRQTPFFRYLLKVKPGLTSWGMVQFGYAQNVNDMIERMKYDLVYIENISLLLDLKISLYTLRTIFLGKGV